MRRKSTRNASKSTPDKSLTEAETPPPKSRRSRRRKRSPSKSSESEDEVVDVPKQVENTPDTTTKSHSPTDDDEMSPQEPVWKVTSSDDTPRGEIQKLKICLARPAPDSPEKATRRSKSRSQTEDDATTSSEDKSTTSRRTRSRGSPFEVEERKGKGKSKGKNKSKIEQSPAHLNETGEMQTVNTEISENAQVTPQSPTIDKPDNENDCNDGGDIQSVCEEQAGDSSRDRDITEPDRSEIDSKQNSEDVVSNASDMRQYEDEAKTPPLVAVEICEPEEVPNAKSKSVLEPQDSDEEPLSAIRTPSPKKQLEKIKSDDAEIANEENKPTVATVVAVDEKKTSLIEQNEGADNEGDSNDKITISLTIDAQIENEEEGPATNKQQSEDGSPIKKENQTAQLKDPQSQLEHTQPVVNKTQNEEITDKVDEHVALVESEKSEDAEVAFKDSDSNQIAPEVVENVEQNISANKMEEDSAEATPETSQEHDKVVAKKRRYSPQRQLRRDLSSRSDSTVQKPRSSRPRKWSLTIEETSSLIRINLETLQSLCPSIEFPEEPDLNMEKPKERRKSQHPDPTPKPSLERKVSVEYGQNDLEKGTNKEGDDNSNIIAFNRKISIVDDTASKLKPPPSPAKNPVSEVLFITNLVRPFTLKQLKELLERTGKIKDEGFWTDRIKSKCYVNYESAEEAEATRNALHGVQWPIGNGKNLIIDYATVGDLEKAKNPPPPPVPVVPEVKAPPPKENVEPADNKPKKEEKKPSETDRKINAPVREWDIGKKDHQHRDRSRSRDRVRKHRRSRTPVEDFITKKQRKQEETAPQKLMDDLFLKTKATPSIYWQPLSPEEILLKQQQRLIRMEEHKRRMEENSRLRGRDVGRGAFRRRYD